MTVEWFTKGPGETVAILDGPAGPRDPDGAADILLVGLGRPDWVRLPMTLGGTRARVLATVVGPCEVHGGWHECPHYHLDHPEGLFVVECDRFYFCRPAAADR